jgi:hypothetical protein
MKTPVKGKTTAAAPDFAAYVAARDAADNALANIRTIRTDAKEAKETIKTSEPSIMKAMTEAGGRLVVGDSLLEFTKGKQVRVTTVAVA